MLRLSITLILFFLFSCQTAKLTGSLKEAKKNICKSMRGKGRIVVAGQKQVFSFQTEYDPESLHYNLNLTFPIHGTESVEVEYIQELDKPFKISSSFEQRMLRQKEGANPQLINSFLSIWANFFEELLIFDEVISENRDINFNWVQQNNELLGKVAWKNYFAQFDFKYPSTEGHFERVDVLVRSDNSEEEIILQLIVRKCLETDIKSVY